MENSNVYKAVEQLYEIGVGDVNEELEQKFSDIHKHCREIHHTIARFANEEVCNTEGLLDEVGDLLTKIQTTAVLIQQEGNELDDKLRAIRRLLLKHQDLHQSYEMRRAEEEGRSTTGASE